MVGGVHLFLIALRCIWWSRSLLGFPLGIIATFISCVGVSLFGFVVLLPCMLWFCGAGVGIRVAWLSEGLVGVGHSASWWCCSYIHLSRHSYQFTFSRTVEVGADLQWCCCWSRRDGGHLFSVGVCGCGVLVNIGHYSSLYLCFYSLSIIGGASECCSPHDCAGSFPLSPAS